MREEERKAAAISARFSRINQTNRAEILAKQRPNVLSA
jgi:hypothetical protein